MTHIDDETRRWAKPWETVVPARDPEPQQKKMDDWHEVTGCNMRHQRHKRCKFCKHIAAGEP